MRFKKMLAMALSTSMAVGMSLSAAAADPEVIAPIYSFEVLNVVVPTTYAVAFNPEGLTVKTDDTNTSTSQILSKNYGMINKGNKDQIMTVTLTVEDQNTGASGGVTFVDSAQNVTDAEDGEYKVHLTAIPADTTEVKVGSTPASADENTTAADLNNVSMTKAAAGKEVTLKAGVNKIGFKLEKAVYQPKSGSEVTLGTTTSNDVASNYEISSLAANGKGISAFTFGGEMNANADWTKLSSGIKITAVYSSAVASSGATVIDGTGAMVTVVSAPTFTAGTDVGTISYTAGTGDDALASITKITMPGTDGTGYDGYHGSGSSWGAATDENGLITLDSRFIGIFAGANPDDATREATITYVTVGDVTKTVTVDVKLR